MALPTVRDDPLPGCTRMPPEPSVRVRSVVTLRSVRPPVAGWSTRRPATLALAVNTATPAAFEPLVLKMAVSAAPGALKACSVAW